MNKEQRNMGLGEWELDERPPTLGERLADKVANVGGSWTFVILFITIMATWITLNVTTCFVFDPYPFILLNLVLSTIAAFQAPAIMMSQKRQAQRDRAYAKVDFEQSRKSERVLLEIDSTMFDMLHELRELRQEVETLKQDK
jgi:uncharacterized membrane protein